MIEYVATFAVGVAGGILLEKAMAKLQADKITERSQALRHCFGDPMFSTIFSLSEVKEWITSRKDLLSGGAKAIVVKANNDTLKNLGKEINIEGVDNYLIIAIIDTEHNIKDSILVKYEKLDQNLENILAKGNGCLVVEE